MDDSLYEPRMIRAGLDGLGDVELNKLTMEDFCKWVNDPIAHAKTQILGSPALINHTGNVVPWLSKKA